MPPPAFPTSLFERIFKCKSFSPASPCYSDWNVSQMIPSDSEAQFKVCVAFLIINSINIHLLSKKYINNLCVAPFIGVEQCILSIYRVQYSTEDFFTVKDKLSPSPCPYISVLQRSHFLSLSCMKSWDY